MIRKVSNENKKQLSLNNSVNFKMIVGHSWK